MNKLPPAIYAWILPIVIVVTLAVVIDIKDSIYLNGVWGLWPILILIVVVSFIVYRFRSKKVGNKKPRNEQGDE